VPTHRFEFDPAMTDVVGTLQSTVVGKEDALPDIARRFNLGYEEIVRANPGVDPWLPGEGRRVLLPTRFVLPDAPREGLVVNLAAMRLFWFPKREPGKLQVVYTYPIGIGRVGWVTPEGSTRVLTRVKDPAWRPPLSVRKEHAENGEILPALVPAGPDNPLGAHMFRLGWPGYLIHGTNKPYGVGMRSSHGCLRLYPEDIAKLYEQLPIGTKVTVVNQPLVLGWEGGHLHAQAYEVLEDDKRDWRHAPKALRKRANAASPLWKRIRAHDAELDWEATHQVSLKPLGVPVSVMKQPVSVPASGAAPLAESTADGPNLGLGYPLKGVPPVLVARIAPLFRSAQPVRNAVPPGANWSGRLELRVDEAQFRQMQAEIEAPVTSVAVSAVPPPASTTPRRGAAVHNSPRCGLGRGSRLQVLPCLSPNLSLSPLPRPLWRKASQYSR
jgi:L,D-transpeptidase ErfK/SrfK